MNKWRVSPPNASLQFGWKRAARHSMVQHSRGLHLWKCYYFVTTASHFANHFNAPATQSSIFMPTIILLEQASHFQTVNISLWNEAFQRLNSLFAVITLDCQRVAAAIWLPLHDLQAGEERVSPQLFTPGWQNKSKKKTCTWKNVLFMNSCYLYRTLPDV